MRRLLRFTVVLAAILAVIALSSGRSTRLRAAQNSGGAAPSTPAQSTPAQPPATPQSDPQQPPIFRTGINFVRVDVIVTDKAGNPVNDLKPGDFEITEQNRPQKIETFKLISLDGGLIASTAEPPRQIRTDADEESEAGRDDVR